MTTEKQAAQQAEALNRAKNGQSLTNEAIILEAAALKGIPDAIPRVNVFSFNAWKAQGRIVRKGQKALCKVTTFITIRDKDTDKPTGKRARSVAVFHISQTDNADSHSRRRR